MTNIETEHIKTQIAVLEAEAAVRRAEAERLKAIVAQRGVVHSEALAAEVKPERTGQPRDGLEPQSPGSEIEQPIPLARWETHFPDIKKRTVWGWIQGREENGVGTAVTQIGSRWYVYPSRLFDWMKGKGTHRAERKAPVSAPDFPALCSRWERTPDLPQPTRLSQARRRARGKKETKEGTEGQRTI